ncbi:MAG: hypothetical protein M0Q87_03220 [Ottowia sp.]|nr:hypothetical protein [Ottowia sp.]
MLTIIIIIRNFRLEPNIGLAPLENHQGRWLHGLASCRFRTAVPVPGPQDAPRCFRGNLATS